MSALSLRGVGRRFGAMVGVAGVDLDVAAGSRTAIVGPSGSGKTTLLRVIAGFESPDAGEVTLDGELVADAAHAIAAHRRRIGFVPQDGALFPHLSVAANVGFGLAGTPDARAARVRELMDLVALDRSMLRRWPHELSGGQQQRVALARALAHKPSLMLLDEPFSALDTGLRASTRKAVAQLLSDAGITTILVTHDQAEALSFADQLAVMREGRLVQVGDPIHVYRHPADEATASFLGDAIVLDARIDHGFANCALGRIAVGDTAQRGAVRIMLRPEQFRLAEVAAADVRIGEHLGVVTAIDFGGPSSDVSIVTESPVGANSPRTPLSVRYPSNEVPALGARVRIDVIGEAHIFGEAVASPQNRM